MIFCPVQRDAKRFIIFDAWNSYQVARLYKALICQIKHSAREQMLMIYNLMVKLIDQLHECLFLTIIKTIL